MTAKSDSRAKSIDRRSRLLWLGVSVLIIATFALSYAQWRSKPIAGTTKPGETPVASRVEAPTERELSYWFTALRNPERNRRAIPFEIAGEGTIVRRGDQLRLNLISQGNGFLYVINESAQRNRQPGFIVLYPDMTVGGGSASIRASQEVRIPPPSSKPELDWWRFDKDSGTEKIWLVWSAHEVPLLETVKVWSNSRSGGLIGDAKQSQELSRYLEGQPLVSPAHTKVATDEGRSRTVLRASNELIIHYVTLEHR